MYQKMKKTLIIIAIKVILTSASHYVIRSIDPSQTTVAPSTALLHPIVYDMGVQSNISNRFAKTLVTNRVKNPSSIAQETTFTVVLPEKAFISGFILEIEGKQYKAYVKEKEEAKQIYNQAVQRGQTAGHVSVSARDSNKFTVSVNVEPEATAAFLLTYEELLERKNYQYELIINIHPGQVVDDLHVQVYINESRPLTFVKTPFLRSGHEMDKNNENLDPSSDIQIIEKKTAVVKFTPDTKRQENYAKEFGTSESGGLSGQFVVQYDVERDPHGGEVLLQDGYFVHFFAPDNLRPLSKYIVFVLDTSGSMIGRKINQLKDAMENILDQLNPGDFFSVIEFNSNVYGWNIDTESKNMVTLYDYQNPLGGLKVEEIPRPSAMDDQIIKKGKRVMQTLNAGGITNIIAGLEVALTSVKLYSDKNQETFKKLQPIIMFLTDGQPFGGISDTKEITRIITKLNLENNRIPIYSLSFGESADKDFLRKLSLNNFGFSRHIYEASDASLQLQNFYKEIASPLLSNIEFKYNDVINVTKMNYPVFYKGSEIIVGGYYRNSTFPTEFVKIHGTCGTGMTTLNPQTINKPVSSLERLWAYLTVKQKLDERDIAENKEEPTQRALDLALKYAFVTDVTSLVVVKPNDTQSAALETARPDVIPDNDSSPSKIYFNRFPMLRSGGSIFPWGAASKGQQQILSEPRAYQGMPGSSHQSSYAAHTTSAPIASPVYATVAGVTFPPISATGTWISSLPPSTQNLYNSLPWLTGALNPNKTLTIKGVNYQFVDNYNPVSSVRCTKTPLNPNDFGSCKLLKDCPEVYSYLTDLGIYKQFFCPVDYLYAGVCCPIKTG